MNIECRLKKQRRKDHIKNNVVRKHDSRFYVGKGYSYARDD